MSLYGVVATQFLLLHDATVRLDFLPPTWLVHFLTLPSITTATTHFCCCCYHHHHQHYCSYTTTTAAAMTTIPATMAFIIMTASRGPSRHLFARWIALMPICMCVINVESPKQ